MAGSVNRAILIGRCGKDPTVRYTQDNRPIVSFSIATSTSWKDRASGERREDTTWHNIVIFNTRLADVAEKYVRKGSHVYVEGEIKNRSWEKDGQKHYITEIVIPAFNGQLHLLSSPSTSAPREEASDGYAPQEATRTDPRGNPQYGGATGGAGAYDDGDEIPFSSEWR